MIIWLNGAFGSGKTQTAYELHKRIENSYVYDPENIGFFLDKNMPKKIRKMTRGDFQNYPLWRQINYDLLMYLSKNTKKIIIVPMTITNVKYYEEIIGKLTKEVEVKHFILSAKKETILKRLHKRLETNASWAAKKIDSCLKAFEEEITEKKIQTDDKNIDEVVEQIAKDARLLLKKDKRSRWKKKWDRFMIQWKHIRWKN